MKKEKLLFALGVWTAILSFLGFPSGIKSVLFALTGFAVAYLAYIFYKKAKKHASKNENSARSFIDNIENEK